MLTLAALAALALSAPSDAKPPFPPPRATAVTEKTKCDTGTVAAAELAKSKLQVSTPAGLVTYRAGAEAQVFDKDGKPLGTIARLAVGQKVRVYYVVDDGAKASEVDVE
jgi:hypothetical protein